MVSSLSLLPILPLTNAQLALYSFSLFVDTVEDEEYLCHHYYHSRPPSRHRLKRNGAYFYGHGYSGNECSRYSMSLSVNNKTTKNEEPSN
jgi:hypothetical protein